MQHPADGPRHVAAEAGRLVEEAGHLAAAEAGRLVEGAGQLVEGAGQLAAAEAGRLVEGAGQLVEGAGQLAATEAGRLVEGAEQLVEDAGALAAAEARRAATEALHAAADARRWWGRHLQEMRWQAELARLLVDPLYLGVGVPRGTGRPVVLVPGFLAGDGSLAVLGEWLDRIGHRAHGSGILFNVDCSDKVLRRLEARVERIVEHAGDKAAILGHSRGGHFAKALANRRPDLVRSVVSLGSGLDTPFDISVPTRHAVRFVRAVHAATTDRDEQRGCMTRHCTCEFGRHYSDPFPDGIPLTSIYSRGDGVVWWEACVVPYARCVEVSGSHVGLAFNRKVYRVVAEALVAD